MGVHKFRPSSRPSPLRDPVERAIAEAFGSKIVALRLKHQLSRLVVVQRTGINWKRLRQLEEGQAGPGLHEVVKLAGLFVIAPGRLTNIAIRGMSPIIGNIIGEDKKGRD